jgi:uncharacterized protein (TIGR03663 family)
VSTASTKSGKGKNGGLPGSSIGIGSYKPGPNDPAPAVNEEDISRLVWLVACLAILALAAFLRFYDLDLVPLHHDEGVNGNFLVRLVRDRQYQYDPGNYHGPTLYYLAAVFPWLLRMLFGPNAQNNYGLTTEAIRSVPALFGLATIGLVFVLRRNLGTIATLSAAGLLAISPGAVYLSRYFIHETLFVFFTLGIVVAAIRYYETSHPVYLILGAISAALLLATKETAVISVAVLAIAFICTFTCQATQRALGIVQASPEVLATGKKKRRNSKTESGWDRFLEGAGGPGMLMIWLAVAAVAFMVVYVLFYTSFFKNYPKGLLDSLKTFEFWTKTGETAHVHPFVTYIWWLLLQESPLLVLGVVGALVALFKPVKPAMLFSAFWAFGLIAAYSLIKYKTPWLSLNFVVPLALTSGVAVQWLYDELGEWRVSPRTRVLTIAGVLLVVLGPLPFLAGRFERVARAAENSSSMREALAEAPRFKTLIPGYQTIDLNFVNYDNDDRYYVYVYAHTRRETLKLVDLIEQLAQRTHQGSQMGITIVSPDYWPLPWYLRNYNRVGYYGKISPSTEPVILASAGQVEEVETTYGDRYKQVHSGFNVAGSFPLRPGVDLLLYTRRELVP